MHKCPNISTFLPTLFVSCFFNNSHPDRYQVTSHCGLDLHFSDHLMVSDVEPLFVHLLAICMCFLKKHLLKPSAHFLTFCSNWVVGDPHIFGVLTYGLQASSPTLQVAFSLCCVNLLFISTVPSYLFQGWNLISYNVWNLSSITNHFPFLLFFFLCVLLSLNICCY